MHDIRWIRENPGSFIQGMRHRGIKSAPQRVKGLLDLDRKRRDALARAERLQKERNEISAEIGIAKSREQDISVLLKKVTASKDEQIKLERLARKYSEQLDYRLRVYPNIAAKDVPVGPDESSNRVIRYSGTEPQFSFRPRQHFEIGETLHLMDFEAAAKLAGARFVVLKGELARLERALASFMLHIHTNEFEYTEISPPILVLDSAMFGTGQLPRFRDESYFTMGLEIIVPPNQAVLTPTSDGDYLVQFRNSTDQQWFDQLSDNARVKVVKGKSGRVKRIIARERRWLIPTAEVPLTNLVADEILDAEALPLRFTALTPCFRAEAGAAGKDTRGMLRQHQFNKVELVSVTAPEDSEAEHERMTGCAEEVLKRLGLHYRVVALSTGDMGFAARKTYDIEVWLPGQGTYREISSCSNCGDFQARRMKARLRRPGQKGTEFVHTLNGSGLAVGRTLIALLENYQREDGSVAIPEALRKYMDGADAIGGGA